MVNGLLFISSWERQLVYDADSLEYLYELDAGPHQLDYAVMLPIKGSDLIAVVYNLNDSWGVYSTSTYMNPQILLYDPKQQKFLAQLDLDDSILSGSSSSIPNMSSLGILLYGMENGQIALRSSHVRRNGPSYMIFDPVLRAEATSTVTASVEYEETYGYKTTLRRQEADRPIQILNTRILGNGGIRTVNVPLKDITNGVQYSLSREEKIHVVNDYTLTYPELSSQFPLNGFRSTQFTPGAEFFLQMDIETTNSSFDSDFGRIRVIDIATGAERFVFAPGTYPNNRRFGNRVSVSKRYIAAGTQYVQDDFTVYNLETGLSMGIYKAAIAFAVTDKILVRIEHKSQSGIDRFYLNTHRIHDREELCRVEVDYKLPFASDRPPVYASDDFVVFDLNVYDIQTGEFLYRLNSPNPEQSDHFGARIVTDKNFLVAMSAKQATAYLFDLATGEHLQTFRMEEWPDGSPNYSSSTGPRLALDTETGVFAWSVIPEGGERNSISLFDLTSGRRFAKVMSPVVIEQLGSDQGPIDYETARESIGSGIALHGNRLFFRFGKMLTVGVATLDFEALIDAKWVDEVVNLAPERYMDVQLSSRQDVRYLPKAGPHPHELNAVGDVFPGTGTLQEIRFPIPDDQDDWFVGFGLEWSKPYGNY